MLATTKMISKEQLPRNGAAEIEEASNGPWIGKALIEVTDMPTAKMIDSSNCNKKTPPSPLGVA